MNIFLICRLLQPTVYAKILCLLIVSTKINNHHHTYVNILLIISVVQSAKANIALAKSGGFWTKWSIRQMFSIDVSYWPQRLLISMYRCILVACAISRIGRPVWRYRIHYCLLILFINSGIKILNGSQVSTILWFGREERQCFAVILKFVNGKYFIYLPIDKEFLITFLLNWFWPQLWYYQHNGLIDRPS